jgi:spore coat polysaccharide biosynthesis protein SpsF
MILAILQARMTSTRLPGKVMRPLLGEPMIGRQIERIARARRIVRLVVATSNEASDHALAVYCARIGVAVHRGTLVDSLTRYVGALAAFGPVDHVVRLTADCPLTDWTVIDDCIALHVQGGFEFTSNAMQRSFPKGLDVEVMTASVLDRLSALSASDFEREHVTQYAYDHPETFRCGHLLQAADESERRWTVDTPADFAMVEAVYGALYPANPAFTSDDIRTFLARRPDVAAINGA